MWSEKVESETGQCSIGQYVNRYTIVGTPSRNCRVVVDFITRVVFIWYSPKTCADYLAETTCTFLGTWLLMEDLGRELLNPLFTIGFSLHLSYLVLITK